MLDREEARVSRDVAVGPKYRVAADDIGRWQR